MTYRKDLLLISINAGLTGMILTQEKASASLASLTLFILGSVWIISDFFEEKGKKGGKI